MTVRPYKRDPKIAAMQSQFLDWLCAHPKVNAKSDAHLCRMLDVRPPVVSKMRHGVLTFGPSFIIGVHELLDDMPTKEIKQIMASFADAPAFT